MSSKEHEGNYAGSSKNIEVESVKRMNQRWKKDASFEIYTHDKDGATRSLMNREMPHVFENLDRNHLLMFDRCSIHIKKQSIKWTGRNASKKLFPVLKLDITTFEYVFKTINACDPN